MRWIKALKVLSLEENLPWIQTTWAPFLFSFSHLPCLLTHSFTVLYWRVKATNEEPRIEGDYNQPSTWLSFQTLHGSGVGGILRTTGIMWQKQFIKLAHRQRLSGPISAPASNSTKKKNEVGNKRLASLFLKDNEICSETGHAEKSSKNPEAQIGRNWQNMQSGINSYSIGLIEGLVSFGCLAACFSHFWQTKIQSHAKGWVLFDCASCTVGQHTPHLFKKICYFVKFAGKL